MALNVLTCHKQFGEMDHEVHLIALPQFHSFGQTVQMNAGLAARATLVLMARFDACGALELMRRHHVSFFAEVPTMYWALLGVEAGHAVAERAARNLSSAVSGGAPIPVEVNRWFRERFGTDIAEGYGLSETNPLATFTPRYAKPRPGSIGQSVWGVEVGLRAKDEVSEQFHTCLGIGPDPHVSSMNPRSVTLAATYFELSSRGHLAPRSRIVRSQYPRGYRQRESSPASRPNVTISPPKPPARGARSGRGGPGEARGVLECPRAGDAPGRRIPDPGGPAGVGVHFRVDVVGGGAWEPRGHEAEGRQVLPYDTAAWPRPVSG